jgi:predicted DsbA family dithiol-disulfide isomerase
MFSQNSFYILKYCCFCLILQRGFDKAMKAFTDKVNSKLASFSDRLISTEKRIETGEERSVEMGNSIQRLSKAEKKQAGAVASNII